MNTLTKALLSAALLIVALAAPARSPLNPEPVSRTPGSMFVYADVIHTMKDGKLNTIADGVIWIDNGTIRAVGPVDEIALPRFNLPARRAPVAIPGIIDPRSTAGLTGIFNNQREDQDALETSAPIQPELRAVDAYNPLDPLITFLRNKGVTTLHTGHAPGEAVSGQTMLVKTAGTTVTEALIREPAALVATLAPSALNSGAKAPGTRAKLVAILREKLIDAREYQRARDQWNEKPEDERGQPPARDLAMDTLANVLEGRLPLLITANKAQDIDSAIRLRDEFGFTLWLDHAAESYLLTDDLKGTPVFLHPTMARPWGDMQNMSWTTASVLADAGITVLMQSGYEAYVPKVRVVLFEAAIAAVHGLGFERALASITHDPATVLGIDARVGSIEPGKDGDIALYSGDPFEYTTICVGTIIEGTLVSEGE